jgi:hypothetical protein
VEKNVVQGVLAEISMRAKLLRASLERDPSSVEEVLAKIEALEEELLGVVKVCLEFDR